MTRTLRGIRNNQNGQSLIQVMISVAIMGVVVAAFATMSQNQQRQIMQSNQKIASLDLIRLISVALADPGACTAAVTSVTTPSFDPTTAGGENSPEFNLSRIPASSQAGSPSAVEVSNTQPASPLSSSLFVTSIKLTNISCGPAPCNAGSNRFTGNIEIGFDGTKLVTPLAALKFPIIFGTTPGGAGQQFSFCNGGSPPPCVPTVTGNCSLPGVISGAATGTCVNGTSGSCSYTCGFGTWTSPFTYTCAVPAPAPAPAPVPTPSPPPPPTCYWVLSYPNTGGGCEINRIPPSGQCICGTAPIVSCMWTAACQ